MNPEEMNVSTEENEDLSVDEKELERALYVLKIERECVSRDCRHDCANCDLALDMDWVSSAYDEIIRIMEYILKPGNGVLNFNG